MLVYFVGWSVVLSGNPSIYGAEFNDYSYWGYGKNLFTDAIQIL